MISSFPPKDTPRTGTTTLCGLGSNRNEGVLYVLQKPSTGAPPSNAVSFPTQDTRCRGCGAVGIFYSPSQQSSKGKSINLACVKHTQFKHMLYSYKKTTHVAMPTHCKSHLMSHSNGLVKYLSLHSVRSIRPLTRIGLT